MRVVERCDMFVESISAVKVTYNDTDRDLLLVRKLPKLTKQTNQGSLPKSMSHTGMKCNGGSYLRQLSDPPLGDPVRNKVNLVEYKDQMFMRCILDVLFDHGAPRAGDVARINNVKNDIGAV